MRLILLFILLAFTSSAFSQVTIGQWREHLPYSHVTCLADDENNRIYAATEFSLFYFDKSDNSIHKISSVNQLSDIGVSTIAYHPDFNTLIIGYENGNIDLLKNDRVSNLPDIEKKQMVGSKKINHIYPLGDYAYLSTDFGIVVLDLKRNEIKETYYIGPNAQSIRINQLIQHQDTFYAVSEMGIYKASANNPNLINFQNWSRITDIPNSQAEYMLISTYYDDLIVAYKGSTYASDTLYINQNNKWNRFLSHINGPFTVLKGYKDTLIIGEEYGFIYYYNHLTDSFNAYDYNQPNQNQLMPQPRDIILDQEHMTWIGDREFSLVKNPRAWNYEFIQPSGPFSKFVWNMSVSGSHLWAVSGGYQVTGSSSYLNRGAYQFFQQQWNSINSLNTTYLDTIYDLVSVAVNPQNPLEVFIGSWGNGLIHLKNNKLQAIYNSNNSSLSEAVNRANFVAIPGLHYDDYGNLWVSNSSTPNALSRRASDGTWTSYNLAPYISEDITGDLVLDDYDQIWLIVQRGRGIAVYNRNQTDSPFDDLKVLLNGSPGNGGLPSSTVYSIAKDHDGEIWVGTAAGIAVFYAPELIFTGNEFDAQQIYVEQEGISQYLLESEAVTAIAIDGANRKWLGTQNSGVFLMSADGTEQIHHFTSNNSPLLSNTILDIAIDQQSGEVFFGTEKGIISYRSDATAGQETHDSVLVFPNPVRPDYYGTIAIKGLVNNADVKITDIAGNLILSTQAKGGTATWNGKTLDGKRVGSGVYLVFSSNEDGSESMVSKILFIK